MFDFGRSDLDNPGLLTFKDRWGATRSSLIYSGFPLGSNQIDLDYFELIGSCESGSAWCVICHPAFVQMAGGVLYRHIA